MILSIWPIDGNLTETNILGQSGPGRNGNEVVLHTFQNRSLTIRCHLVKYTGCLLFFLVGVSLIPQQGMQTASSKENFY